MVQMRTPESHPESVPPPRRAAVVPRARREGEAARIPVEQLVLELHAENVRGVILLAAPQGGGKSAAISHLRATLPPDVVTCVDDISEGWIVPPTPLTVVATSDVWHDNRVIVQFELCPWNDDDCMEYLIANHRAQCGSVLRRLLTDRWRSNLVGSPQLLAAVLDKMAGDESLTDAQETLRKIAWDAVPDSIRLTESGVWSALTGKKEYEFAGKIDLWALPEFASRGKLWRHEAVQRVFAAQWIVERLSAGFVPEAMNNMSAAAIITEIASAIRSRPEAIEKLERIIRDDRKNNAVPMAASVLLRVDPNWRPPNGPLNLLGANLRSARWWNIDLCAATLAGADLTDADLSSADLTAVDATNACLARANLRRTGLQRAQLSGADLNSTNLSYAHGMVANLNLADLRDSNLTGSNFQSATFDHAKLENAKCARVNFGDARFTATVVDGCDFRNASFRAARLRHLRMGHADWTNASFHKADVIECNLEGLTLPDADFSESDLTGSLFTGTYIPRGNFRDAILRDAGLAEIDWEYACLLNADLTHASFHLGSTRSGKVASITPSEGSKTGFYTDEYHEQDFKSPEEIRKASLWGADLRNAIVHSTDFYLVDLRRALYSESQAVWFARCGAILVSRVA